jgi:formimidoylglutamate deiminase
VDGNAPVARILAPDCVVTPAQTLVGWCVLAGADGRCRGIVPRAEAMAYGLEVEELPRRALLPGFVNAHSHVFQRRLRGRTHHGDAGVGGGGDPRDTFWTWRAQMYAEAAALDPELLYTTARECYAEMAGAGYTTVGEFHYVHNAPDGTPYDDPLAMSRAIVAAASETGIRLVLLPVAYTRGGFDRGLRTAQRRFAFGHVEAYLRFVDDVRAMCGAAGHHVGVAPHSVRAVPEDWLRPIAEYATTRGLALHVHASEQAVEVRDTLERYGCTPIGLLARAGALGPRTTVVHGTHATEGDCRVLAAAGAAVCVCPTTEGDLGDGIAPYASFVAHGLQLAIGSDGQTRIDPFEELRWAEFSARMRYQRRSVLARGAGTGGARLASAGETLLAAGTAGGARSLGLEVGTLGDGCWADLVAVDLEHPSVKGTPPAALRDALIFGAGAGVVTDVWVAGRRIHGRW